jgi:hypothetical protein
MRRTWRLRLKLGIEAVIDLRALIAGPALMCFSMFATAQWNARTYVQASATANALDGNSAIWTSNGFNAVGVGEGGETEARMALVYQQQNPDALSWQFHISALARHSSFSVGGRAFGPLETYLDLGSLSVEGWRLRFGQAFAATSQENIEDFWQTPYTLGLSAVNAWIGEEFRPIGASFTRRWDGEAGHTDVELGLYQGNDTGPAMLAWRGFALHHRLSVYGESIPLPRQRSLGQVPVNAGSGTAPELGVFAAQRDAGTQAFGPDLDGRLGGTLRVRRALASGVNLSAFYTDNRGDQDLHDGDEYAWRNRFGIVGFSVPLDADWTVLAESLWGRTEMGFAPGPNVQARFAAQYLLLSRSVGSWVWSGRVDRFRIKEQDFSSAEQNDQRGYAITLAAQRSIGNWRLGAEVLHADIERPGLRAEGFDIAQGGSQLMLLLRYYFDDF